MRSLIADTFQDSVANLDSVYHTAVKSAAFDLYSDPSHPSFQFHRVERAKEKNFWTARVNDDIRIVVYKDGENFVLCYVAHHDAAYHWAESRRFSINETTGAVQIVFTKEIVNEIIKPKVVVYDEYRKPPLFDRYDNEYLMLLGVPEDYLDAVKVADEDQFLDSLVGILPAEAAENLLNLAAGGVIPTPTPKTDVDPFLHPDAQRRFQVIDKDAKNLERALNVPWDKWAIFLHPSQQEIVDMDYSGPARVTGGAGTGKTVVALHRAARLASKEGARVLLTTYSRTLAARLQHHLRSLLGDGPELRRIRVTHLHSLAADVWREASNSGLNLFDPQRDLTPLMQQAIADAGGSDLSLGFLETEWATVVDTEGVNSWNEYKNVSRAGRGTPLGARQRLDAWKVFEALHDLLAAKNLRTWQRVCYETEFILERRPEPLFDHVVADEIQDFGPAELSLLRALAPQGDNDIFLAGDMGQRIYKGRTSFARAGLEIRGRSSVLRLNYRTTEQIRRYADTILPNVLADDGEDERRGSVSLLVGPEPEFELHTSSSKEVAAVERWLKAQVSSGYRPHEIAVFARTNKLLKDRVVPAIRHCNLNYHELSDDEPPQERCVSIGTMHRAKGLEYKVVVVMGCEEQHLPLQLVVRNLTEQAARDTFFEQERSLFYVACTRARERLLVSCAGTPSTFIR